MGQVNSKEEMINLIKHDKDEQLKDYWKKHSELLLNSYINKSNDLTALCIAAMVGSRKCIKFLLESGNEVNMTDLHQWNTPLMYASMGGHLPVVQLLLDRGADPSHKNAKDINAIDFAVIYGHYPVAYYFHSLEILSPKRSPEEYAQLISENKCKMFNVQLFYDTLLEKVDPEKAPIFELPKKQQKDLIPDPNETWGNFIKRLAKFDLYSPPMIQKSQVPLEKRNSAFLKAQTKLVELQYGLKINLQDEKETSVEMKATTTQEEKEKQESEYMQIASEKPDTVKDQNTEHKLDDDDNVKRKQSSESDNDVKPNLHSTQKANI